MSRCRIRGWFVAIAVLLALVPVARAQSSWHFGNVQVIDETVAPADAGYGYIDHRFTLINHSRAATHRVTLSAPARERSHYTHRISRLSRSVELPPGARAQLSIPQPPLPLSGEGFRVQIDGWVADDVIRSRLVAASGRHGHGNLFVLASPGAMDVPSVTEQWLTQMFHFTRHPRSPEQWSRQWLSYSAFAAVVFTRREWEDAPAELRQTLLDYVRAGGVLAILGQIALPDGAVADGDAAGPRSETARLGFGIILQLEADRMAYALDAEPWLQFAEWANDTHQALTRRSSIIDAHRAFALIDNLDVPIRSLFVLLVVFALVAGPVNLLVLTKKRRRIWLLWTTPLISLLFCGSVIGYTLFADGITPTVRVGTITLLDQQSRHAVTLGWLGYYAPLAPRQGLRFDDRTELTPQTAGASYNEPGWSRSMQWIGDQQQLTSGWVSPGVPSHFRVRQVGTQRRRLELERDESGGLYVVNHLEAPIVRVHVVDAEGYTHVAERVEPGQRAAALRAPEHAVRPSGMDARLASSLRSDVFRRDWLPPPGDALASGWMPRVNGDLPRGSYLAVLEHSPFLDPDLPRYNRREQPSIVIGRLGDGDLAAVRPATSAGSGP